MKIDNLPLIDITDCYSKTDISNKLKLPYNGTSMKKVTLYLQHHKLSIDHFDTKRSNRKYNKIIKNCPVCNKEFETLQNHPREKQTCSHSCSNSYFRSGENNPNYKEDSKANYRTLCFRYHKKECIICKEQNIVAVHHYDENHNNNNIDNLVPLCPTHHTYIHSEFAYLIQAQVDNYVKNFKASALPD